MNKYIFLRLYFFAISMLAIFYCHAQSPLIYTYDNNLFQRTNIIFSVTPTYVFKGKTQQITGTQNLFTQNLLSGEAGLGLVFKIDDLVGLKTGFQVGATPLDNGYKIAAPYDSLFGYNIPNDYASLSLPFEREYFGYVNVPLQIEFHPKLTEKKYFFGAAGVALKWTFFQDTHYNYIQSTSDTSSKTFLSIYTVKSNNRLTVPLCLSAGIGFLLKNKNLLVINLKSETGFTNLVNGPFEFFPGTVFKSTGTYAKKGSYIGLEIGYRLTRGRETKALTSPDAYEFIHNKGHINTAIDSSAIEKIFSKNQIGVNLGTQFNLKPLITSTKGGVPDITTIPFPQLSIDYTFNKNKNWGIKAGLSTTVYQYQYNNVTYYSGNSNVLPYTTNIYFALSQFTLSTSFEYRLALTKTLLLYTDLGMAVGLFGERGSTYASAVDYTLINAQNIVEGQIYQRALFGSNIGLGVLYATKNYNLWRLGATWFNSFTTGVQEDYVFNRGAVNEQTGTTNIKGSNVAINVGYIYSFAPSPYAKTKRSLKIKTMEQFPKPRIASNIFDSIYTKNQFTITSELNFMMQPKVDVQIGLAPLIDTYGTLGFRADYLFSLNKHWSAAAGLGVNRYNYDGDSYLTNNADSIGYNYYFEKNITTLTLNASAEYRLPISRSALWYTDFGLSIGNNFIDAYSYQSQKSTDSSSFVTDDKQSNSLSAGGFIGTGILLTCRNYNQFKIGVQYYQSFSPVLKQDYEIKDVSGNPIAVGSITTSGNYLGVNVGYVFSFKKPQRH